MFKLKKEAETLTPEEITQRIHQQVRALRKNPEALDDLSIETFLRLIGIFYTLPEETRNSARQRLA